MKTEVIGTRKKSREKRPHADERERADRAG